MHCFFIAQGDQPDSSETPTGPEGEPCSPACLKACKNNPPFIFPGTPNSKFKGGFLGFNNLPDDLDKKLRGTFINVIVE